MTALKRDYSQQLFEVLFSIFSRLYLYLFFISKSQIIIGESLNKICLPCQRLGPRLWCCYTQGIPAAWQTEVEPQGSTHVQQAPLLLLCPLLASLPSVPRAVSVPWSWLFLSQTPSRGYQSLLLTEVQCYPELFPGLLRTTLVIHNGGSFPISTVPVFEHWRYLGEESLVKARLGISVAAFSTIVMRQTTLSRSLPACRFP